MDDEKHDEKELTKEDLLDCVDYVSKHFETYEGIEKGKDFFYRCLNKVRALIEEHVE
jgi:hypothetical protein